VCANCRLECGEGLEGGGGGFRGLGRVFSAMPRRRRVFGCTHACGALRWSVRQTLVNLTCPEEYLCARGTPNYHLAIAELTKEARRQYALAHDNLVRVYGMVEGEDGLVWIVMELGVMSLNAFLTSLRPPCSLPLATVLRLTRDVLAALVHLHGQDPRLVHHDLKPPNVVRVPPGVYFRQQGGGGIPCVFMFVRACMCARLSVVLRVCFWVSV
jgi:serine/threonine protein kinase